MSEKSGFKKYMGVTFLIGAGFFTMGLMDPLYDSYVTIFLSKYIPYKWIVGMFMSLDNVLAIFLIPLVSAWSDKTRSPIGRRMPWIIVLLPLSALSFAYIPYAARSSLTALIIVLALLNLVKQSVRGPVVALMPDTVPPEYRSEGNGVINTMGNIAAIVGTLFLARLMDVDVVLPLLGNTKDALAFPAAGLLVFLASIMLLLFVREKKYSLALHSDEKSGTSKEEKTSFLKSISAVLGSSDKSAFFVLLSLFFWFMGYQGMSPYIAEYSILTFHVSTGQGAFAAGMVGIASALSAIPMGYAAGKWGRRRMIRIALCAVSVVVLLQFILSFFVPAENPGSMVFVFWGLMFLFGIFWICIIANSFPMLWQMAGYEKIGLFTGLYYTFSQGAAILSPSIAGLIIDFAGHRAVFVYCAVFFMAAFLTMSRVSSGEKNDV
ncbi:MAG: MFS transporter [Spirochaetaceae bacterium]|jgi:MFS family permease|nr:MFS transporter [Spirochaetaceae bacterium]